MFGPFALAVASIFTGAAIYISFAEQPARLGLDDRALLTEWKPAYDRGYLMQATLAIIGGVLGILEWMVTGRVEWLLGALALLANWPYTLMVIMPTNKTLYETPIDQAGPQTRALIEKWGQLHARRAALGAISAGLYLWASI